MAKVLKSDVNRVGRLGALDPLRSIKREKSLKNCICGGEAIIEHEGSQYFACCVECTYQSKETFVELSDAETAWDNGEIEKLY